MKKQQLYLDTSIISCAIDTRDIQMHELTLKLFEEIKAGEHEAYISEVVIEEITNTPDEKTRKKLIDFTNSLDFEKPFIITDEVIALTDRYIGEKIIPIAHRDDALHAALCTVNNLDILVTWNFDHLVKHKTRMEVFGVNAIMGYRIIDICTPKEVVKDV